MREEKIKKIVREGYAKIANQESSCCVPVNSCCESTDLAESASRKIGYSGVELKSVPQGANLGLGCGNPIALASLKEGETVLDLGSGAGFDCFLAANKVGKNGRVIGVDMTPEMVEKAREIAKRNDYENVKFKLGEIENLPIPDESIDVLISNCVINLSPDKQKVFKEAFRVLKPGGRLMISDIVLSRELPDFVKDSIAAYIGCISGAILKKEYMETIKKAGFQKIKILEETSFPKDSIVNAPSVKAIIEDLHIPLQKAKEVATSVLSINISAVKV